MHIPVHPDLEHAVNFHESIVAEGGKALVGYDTAKALANVVLMSEIPTSYDKKENRQVNAGNLLLRGVPRVGKTFFGVILPAFSFAIATMNPVELGQGTFPLSEAATDRFAIMVNIGYLPPEEEQKLVHFDFKKVRLNPLATKERIIELRGAISEHVFLHGRLAEYIQRLVAATRPYKPDTDWYVHSPSELVEHGVGLGAAPRANICLGRLPQVCALLVP